MAVGSCEFVERVETDLGARARDRQVQPFGSAFILRDPSATYGDVLAATNEAPSPNTAPVYSNREETQSQGLGVVRPPAAGLSPQCPSSDRRVS